MADTTYVTADPLCRVRVMTGQLVSKAFPLQAGPRAEARAPLTPPDAELFYGAQYVQERESRS